MNNRVLPTLLKFGFTLSILFVMFAAAVNAQTRSRIVGTVKDAETGEALIGANVLVKDTYLGAASDLDGKYFIINVPVGTYQLQVSMVGYEPVLITNVVVSADRITTIDVKLKSTLIQGKEIVVTAQQDNLHKEVSSTQMVVDATEIKETSGIREINAFLEKLPGVEETNGYLTIRGGSADQTGTLVNGLSYNNAAVGNAETSVPLSAIDQISLLSGGYNAEYGNFRSGLINITTKTGTKDGYHGTISLSKDGAHVRRFGDPFYGDASPYLSQYLNPNNAFNPTAAFNWQNAASKYNTGKTADQQTSAFDMFLLGNWMYMSIPDYAALDKLPASVKQQIGYHPLTAQQKAAFASHILSEDNSDWDFDGGFGGPVPLIGKFLGDATFYLSNTSNEQHYIMPVTLPSQKTYTTLGTLKATPGKNLTLTYNVLWKREIGVSPIRPAFGDAPDASHQGGFMPINNVGYISKENESSGPPPDRAYWFDPMFYPILNQTTLMNGISINNVLSPKTYWQLTLSYLTIGDYTPTGDNRDSTVLTQFGPFPATEMPFGKLQFAATNTVNGYKYANYDNPFGTLQRFRGKEGDLYDNSTVNQLSAKLELASQVNDNNYVKGGIEYNYIDLNHQFWEKWNQSGPYNVYEFNYHRWPSQVGGFLQDQLTFEEIVANLGLRVDYYDGGGGMWPSSDSAFSTQFMAPSVPPDTSLFTYLASGKSAIWDKWNAYNSTHPGFMAPVKNYLTFSPRIGVSFPVTENSKFYFNYGHFRSNPPYYTMYQLRYRYTKNGLYNMTNPNLEPPRTISYELGFNYNFYTSYILQISGYYKDVTGEPGNVSYTSADGTISYTGQLNNRFEDIQGLEINLTKNDNSWLTGWVNFNYMLTKSGNTGLQQIIQYNTNPSDDQYYHNLNRALPQPQVNANITFRTPDKWGPDVWGSHLLGDWNISFFATYKAGDYFNPSDWNPLGLKDPVILEWPDYYMVDLKISKAIKVGGISTSLYLDISNFFNIKVNEMSNGYAFDDGIGGTDDFKKYMASLHLPMYNSSQYDQLRAQNPGQYIGGTDKVGESRSASKSYIVNPSNTYWIWGQPRDIWFGMRVDL